MQTTDLAAQRRCTASPPATDLAQARSSIALHLQHRAFLNTQMTGLFAQRNLLRSVRCCTGNLSLSRDGIIEHFRSGLGNGGVEAMNAQIQAAKARAKGDATDDNLITIGYLMCAKLRHLPRNPWLRPTAA
ncbi:transposase [Xanthomonas theicola]|uniref:transposase n=1 Tax=Xanthomonas theicola TaxID=56464 RepID=UPI0026B50ED1